MRITCSILLKWTNSFDQSHMAHTYFLVYVLFLARNRDIVSNVKVFLWLLGGGGGGFGVKLSSTQEEKALRMNLPHSVQIDG